MTPKPNRANVLLVVLALALGSFVTFWDLGGAPLENWDEGHHAKVALDMMQAGEWLVYKLDGEIEQANRKPPLMFYALLGGFSLFGPTETAARILPAVSFVALLALITWFVARILTRTAAVVALLLCATSRPFLFEHFAREGVVDAILALALAATMIALWLRARATTLSLAFATALLAKGVAALQILPAAALWLWYVRDRQGARRLVVAVAVAAVPVAAWLILRESAAPGFVAAMVSFDVLGRFTAVVGAPSASPLLYVRRFVGDFDRIAIVVTALLLLARGTVDLGPQRSRGEVRSLLVFLLAWWLIPFALFSAFRTKHEWYVLPSYVPAYVLAAWLVAAALPAALVRLRIDPRPLLVALLVVALTAFVGGKTLSRLVGKYPREAARERAELASLLATAERTGKDCVLSLFRADELPSLRFYLTRAHVRYAIADAHVRGALDAPGPPCVLVRTQRADEVAQLVPALRRATEWRALDVVLLRAEPS